MKNRKINLGAIVLLMTSVFLFAFIIPQDQKKATAWEIPSKYKKMKNEYAEDKSLMKVGKMMWSKHCKSCHGSKGLGNGPKSKQLDTFSGDFSTEAFQAGSDGELYYKSFVGRDEMPNFEKKITDDEDRWAIINYIRTLKK